MSTRATRVVLIVLAAGAAFVGLWAVSAPSSFYTSFPGGSHRWVSADGPYNEHLIRDVGGLYLALLALAVGAIVRPTPQVTRLTGLAWVVFSVPHLAYHSAHLDVYNRTDQILNVLGLGASVLLGLVLCLPRRVSPVPEVAHQVRPTRGGLK
jgi:Domain of unknown function (DUF4345)